MCFRGVDRLTTVDWQLEDPGHRIAKLKLKGRTVELIRPAANDKSYVFIFPVIVDPC